jgi:putative DNA primase/helicase
VETPDPTKPRQKQRDVNLIPKLIAELPGIFNWAYAGYQMLKTVNYFTDTLEQADLLGQFEQTSNPISVFCEDYSESFVGTLTRAEIYGWYKDWCLDTGHKALSREKFIPKLRECLGGRIENETQVRVNGVRTRVLVFAGVSQVDALPL